MSYSAKKEYLALMRERYRTAESREVKSKLLSEAFEVTGMHPKSLIRCLNQETPIDPSPKRGRPRRYFGESIRLLKLFYRESEYVCSLKLKAMLPMLIAQFEGDIADEDRDALLKMSRASIDRYLGEYRKLERRRKNTGTRPGSRLFRRLIPLKNLSNIAPGCGVLEADTVAHCGGNLSGTFIWSLTTTDEFSGWTVNRAIMGKSGEEVLKSLVKALSLFPFELRSLNVDNGTEFMNDLVYGHFLRIAREHGRSFPMTRSRSYQKNDNARAEQKNWMMVRQLFGYERFDSVILVSIMNDIYECQGLIQNYFVPQMKLKSKVRVGASIKKKYDSAVPPVVRVLADPSISDDRKTELKKTLQSLNYYKLRKKKEELLAYFLSVQNLLQSKQGLKAA